MTPDDRVQQEDGWHFPYRDQNKVLHEIVVQADTFGEALELAYAQLMEETSDQ